MKSPETPEVPEPIKKPYQSPRLTVYGNVLELTGAGEGALNDNVGTGMTA